MQTVDALRQLMLHRRTTVRAPHGGTLATYTLDAHDRLARIEHGPAALDLDLHYLRYHNQPDTVDDGLRELIDRTAAGWTLWPHA